MTLKVSLLSLTVSFLSLNLPLKYIQNKRKEGLKMKKQNQKNFLIAAFTLSAFVLWTVLLCFVDTKAIGPKNSTVGFATINQLVHNILGVNMTLYTVTDWLGLVPIFFAMVFGVLGLAQWIKRKSLKAVDYSILVLGGFYIVVITVYILFEFIVINHRPVLINGYLEVSYPSSTTMLVMCVMPTATMQFKSRIRNSVVKQCVSLTIIAFIIFMVVGRLVSGVHWFTDIIGGAILSCGLVMLYYSIIALEEK